MWHHRNIRLLPQGEGQSLLCKIKPTAQKWQKRASTGGIKHSDYAYFFRSTSISTICYQIRLHLTLLSSLFDLALLQSLGTFPSCHRGKSGQNAPFRFAAVLTSLPLNFRVWYQTRGAPGAFQKQWEPSQCSQPITCLRQGAEALHVLFHYCLFIHLIPLMTLQTGKSFHLNAKQMQHVNMLKWSDAKASTP